MFRIMFSLFYRWHIEGAENIPQSGGAVIAPNHIGFFDSTLTGSAIKRPVHFMAKKELFDIPGFGWIIKQTNAFPVKRGMQDISAVRNAFSLLKSGCLLLVFPEGTRSKDGRIGKARAGAGMIACNTQVPLIPTKIENTNMMLKFKQIKIKFGKPVYPPKDFVKNDYINLSKRVLDIISGM
ncbi:lysophospholipid acyltransferase family protein [Candidatus Endomicrobiellum trichonymphae]|uniref:lysophospholipid acyltransferase family protein n=1 Tax=Endomicrobium trichonymphae TaxID=1408204 RepID=UPI0039B996EA